MCVDIVYVYILRKALSVMDDVWGGHETPAASTFS